MATKKKPADYPKKSIEQFQEELNLLAFFYGEDAVHELSISINDIMDIMHCDESTANRLMQEVREYFEEELRENASELIGITTWMFCHYMEIDEMLIQLFLLSIHPPGADDPEYDEPAYEIPGWPINYN